MVSSDVNQTTPKVYLVVLLINLRFEVSILSPRVKIKTKGIPTPNNVNMDNPHSGKLEFIDRNTSSCGSSIELIKPNIAKLKSKQIKTILDMNIKKNPIILVKTFIKI